MRRTEGSSPGLHRLEHREHFPATHLAHDLAAEVEAERVVQRVVDRELARAPPVGLHLAAGPCFPRVNDRVPVLELVKVELVLGLERPDRLHRADLGAQRAQHRGLSRALRAGDDDRLPCPHRRGKERRCDGPEGLAPDELGQRRLTHAMTADHDRRPRRHPGGRCQPRAPVQPQVQPRFRLGELPGVDLGAGREEHEEVDELAVGVGDGRTTYEPAVGVLEPHVVVAEDRHVLHAWVVDQRLEAAEPEQRVEHGLGQRRLVMPVESAPPGRGRLLGLLVQELRDDPPAERLLLG